MFKAMGIVMLIAGFTVPYASHESVEIWQMILIQATFYAIGYYFMFGDLPGE